MPRPKVRPEARRRAVVACVPCQMSKKKCDSRTPCANCCRRSYEANCIYDPKACPRPSRRAGALNTIQARRPSDLNDRRESFVGDFGMNSSSYADEGSTNGVNVPRTPESTLAPCSRATPDPTSPAMSNARGDVPRGQNLGHSTGEKVSMGDSASLSFLDFLRHTFHYYMGPSPFTDKQMAKAMLEAVIPLRVSDDILEGSPESHLNIEEKKDYVDRFFIATTGLIYLYSPQELLSILEESEKTSAQTPDHQEPLTYGSGDAIVDMAIAIGGQGCGTTPKSLYHAQRHFNRAQKFAFEGMLLEPSVDLVALFLMMSTYMLNGCKRNGAFIYLGVSARLAQSLSLHISEAYQHLPPKERRFRAQVWKSLRILDIAFGAVLSQRPASASSPRSRLGDSFFSVSDDMEPKSPEYSSMSGSFDVCLILEQITDHLDHGQETDLGSIQEFLRKLREITEGLPASVRMSTVSSPISSEQRRQTLGNFAVSCFYYYSVILVTRPVLISHLLAKLKLADQSSNNQFDLSNSRETDEIAQVCIDAAVLLVETTRRAHSVGLLLQQMALLKAWLFSACLILGFSIFADVTVSETSSTLEAEAALRGGIFVIRDLAQTSPQAHHYLDVLTEMQSAIHKYRERLVPPRKKKGGQFLSQIFVLDQDKSLTADSLPDTSTFTPSLAPDTGDDSSGAGLWMLQQAAEASQGVNNMWRMSDDATAMTDPSLTGPAGAVPLSVGAFDLHWGSISVQATDDFLFATDSFAGMLDQF